MTFSDYNVPLLVTYHQPAHAVAGALLGVGTDFAIRRFLPMRSREGKVVRVVTAVGVALVAGTVKEYLIDRHPRDKEIGPWGVGAGAAALACEFTWRF